MIQKKRPLAAVLILALILGFGQCKPNEEASPLWMLALLGGSTSADGSQNTDPVNPSPAIPAIGTVSGPVFSPAEGSYNADQNITLTSSTAGAAIYYTTDGSTPATSAGGSTLAYSGGIPVSGNGTSKTIKAIAIKSGMSNSSIASAAYTISYNATCTDPICLGGKVSGLVSGAVVTIQNGSNQYSFSTNGNFGMTAAIGDTYNITIATQPSNLRCVVKNGSGTVGAASVTNVVVTSPWPIRTAWFGCGARMASSGRMQRAIAPGLGQVALDTVPFLSLIAQTAITAVTT